MPSFLGSKDILGILKDIQSFVEDLKDIFLFMEKKQTSTL